VIPAEDKVAYLTALEACPTVVAREADPMRFLRATDYDPWKAAQRMVGFWQMRSQIFENWTRPLNCLESGALSDDARNLLKQGLWVLAPQTDSKGRGVVYYDRRLLESGTAFRNAAVRSIANRVLLATNLCLTESVELVPFHRCRC
jgi:hypothetical protein